MCDQTKDKQQDQDTLAVKDPIRFHICPSHQHEEHKTDTSEEHRHHGRQGYIPADNEHHQIDQDHNADQFDILQAKEGGKGTGYTFTSVEFQINREYLAKDHAQTRIKDHCMEIDHKVRIFREDNSCKINGKYGLTKIAKESKNA